MVNMWTGSAHSCKKLLSTAGACHICFVCFCSLCSVLDSGQITAEPGISTLFARPEVSHQRSSCVT